MVRLHRRQGKMIYSREKPPMEMLFWNICSFEQQKRKLIHWLDRDIPEDKKNRSIKRYDALRG